MMQLSAVSVVYRRGEGIWHALDNISLTLASGEWVAVVGANGSGKSTLSKVLAGLSPVSRGERKTSWSKPGAILMVLQNPESQIIGDTVWEDVLFGPENIGLPREAAEEQALRALRHVGLEPWLHAPVHNLSGGQKQRLSIAGCLAMDPQVLIFDEATTMLDPARKKDVLNLASTLRETGISIVWITQDMNEAAQAQRIVALERGRVCFDGSTADFFYGPSNPCEALGFPPPYPIQIAKALQMKGISLPFLPLGATDLAELVEEITCRLK